MDYAIAESIVLQTKRIVLKHAEMEVSMKGKNDFVTDVDFEISDFVKKELAVHFPQSQFFSEEEKGQLYDDCWILDPIDGTTNLVFGYKLCSVSLAHYLNGRIRYGIVYNPFYEEIFTAEEGKGAYLDHWKKLSVSNRQIENSLVEFGAGSTQKDLVDENFDLVKKIFTDCVDVRRICSSALDLCYIADGRIDGYFEKVLKPWDYAAGCLILAEAGGVTSDYAGDPLQYAEPSSILAGNPAVHAYLKETMDKYYGDKKRK